MAAQVTADDGAGAAWPLAGALERGLARPYHKPAVLIGALRENGLATLSRAKKGILARRARHRAETEIAPVRIVKPRGLVRRILRLLVRSGHFSSGCFNSGWRILSAIFVNPGATRQGREPFLSAIFLELIWIMWWSQSQE